MIAPKVIRDMLDDLVAEVECGPPDPQHCEVDRRSAAYMLGYGNAAAAHRAWIMRSVLPKLRRIRAWANNEVKVRDLMRGER